MPLKHSILATQALRILRPATIDMDLEEHEGDIADLCHISWWAVINLARCLRHEVAACGTTADSQCYPGNVG